MASKSSIEAGRGHVTLGTDDGPLERGLKAAEGKFKQWGRGLVAMGTDLMRLASVAAVPMAFGVQQFANYEQALANLRAAANPTAEAFAAIRTQIEAISRATGTDFADTTNAYAELLKAGVSLESVLGGVGEAAVKFARVSGMEMSATVIALVDGMNVFAREGITASQAANIMNQAADASTISLRDVADSFAAGGSTMALFNQNMRDTATAIAIMGNAGIKGADSGTVLKTLFLRLVTGSETAGAAMAELGLDVRDASGNMRPIVEIIGQLERALAGVNAGDRDRLLADLGGDRGIRGLAILLQSGTAGWNAMQDSMATALTVEQKFAVMTETLYGGLKRAWASIQGVAVATGEALAPALMAAGKVILPLLDYTAELVKNNAGLVQAVAAVAVGLLLAGGSMVAFGSGMLLIAPVFGMLASVASSIGAAFAFIPTLVLWSDYLKYSLFAVTGALRLFGVEMRDIAGPLGFIDDLFDSFMDTLTGIAVGAWDWITDSPLGGFIAEATDLFSVMWATASNVFDMIMEFLAESDWLPLLADIGKVYLAFIALSAGVLGALGYVTYLFAVWVTDINAIRASWLAMVDAVGDSRIIQTALEYYAYTASKLREMFGLIFGPLIRIGAAVLGTSADAGAAAGRIAGAFADAGRAIGMAMGRAWDVTAASFGRMVDGLAGTASQAWSAIKDAFAVGDIALVWEIIKASFQLAWAQIIAFVEPTWNAWQDSFADTFSAVWLSLKVGFITLWGEVKASAFRTFAEIAAESARWAVGPVADLLNAQADSLRTSARGATIVARTDARTATDLAAAEQERIQPIREARDRAAEAGNQVEVDRLQGVLDGLALDAWIAGEQRRIQGTPDTDNSVGRILDQIGGGATRALGGGVFGAFNAQATFGQLAARSVAESPMERMARMEQRQLELAEAAARDRETQRRILANIERNAGARFS